MVPGTEKQLLPLQEEWSDQEVRGKAKGGITESDRMEAEAGLGLTNDAVSNWGCVRLAKGASTPAHRTTINGRPRNVQRDGLALAIALLGSFLGTAMHQVLWCAALHCYLGAGRLFPRDGKEHRALLHLEFVRSCPGDECCWSSSRSKSNL